MASSRDCPRRHGGLDGDEARGGLGPDRRHDIRTFVNPRNRSSVGVIMDVPDMDAVMALMESDEGAAAMEHDGVLAETVEIFIEE